MGLLRRLRSLWRKLTGVVEITYERIKPDAIGPRKAYKTDACFDLFCCESVQLLPSSQTLVSSGVKFQIPEGWEIQIRPRSSSSLRGKLIFLGTVDADYRKEVNVLVRNLSDEPIRISKGERIAQIKVSKVWRVKMTEGPVQDSYRGGFGSSGR